jgi:hypothetical protein
MCIHTLCSYHYPVLWLIDFHKTIVAYLLKVRNVEPEKELLLGNGCETRKNGVTVESGVYSMVRAETI